MNKPETTPPTYFHHIRDSTQGIAVVLISHNMEQVMEVCDRVVVLRLGRKVADEAVATLDGPTLVGYVTGLRRAEA